MPDNADLLRTAMNRVVPAPVGIYVSGNGVSGNEVRYRSRLLEDILYKIREERIVAEPADHVDHASARRHAREAATTEAWRDSEE